MEFKVLIITLSIAVGICAGLTFSLVWVSLTWIISWIVWSFASRIELILILVHRCATEWWCCSWNVEQDWNKYAGIFNQWYHSWWWIHSEENSVNKSENKNHSSQWNRIRPSPIFQHLKSPNSSADSLAVESNDELP